MIRRKLLMILVFFIFSALSIQAQEKIGSTSQPLVGGATVDQQTRRELGLLTLNAPGKSCSASLLNDNWAITASHCIDTATSPDQVTLEADWSATGKETRKAAKIRSFQWTNDLDIALVMIVYPFPRHYTVKYPQLSYRPTSDLMEQRIELFGRGINTLAWQSGSTPMPSQSDNLYRTSDFIVFETDRTYFRYRSIEGAGRAIAGGDSGGPSYFRVWDDPNSSNRQIVRLLAGVHSNCRIECLPGQTCAPPNPWMWASNIPECKDASVEPILSELQKQIAFAPPKPFEEKPIDTDIVVQKPEIVTAPTGSMKRYAQRESSFQEKPYGNVRNYVAASVPDFTGTWATVTAAGSKYTMRLTQSGVSVTGSYDSQDGSIKGVIAGTVTDQTLLYHWSQGDGQKGRGKFTLSEDGAKFEGSWTSSDDPNHVEGSWNGTRQ